MTKFKCIFSVAMASLCLMDSSSETAIAQKPVSPAHYQVQTVNRSNRVVTPRVYSQQNQQPTKPHLQVHPDAVVAASNQKSNSPSYGNGTSIRINNGEHFGDIRDVLGLTNRQR